MPSEISEELNDEEKDTMATNQLVVKTIKHFSSPWFKVL